jgi:hypothetical protein
VEIASLSSVLSRMPWARLLPTLLVYPWNADAAMVRFAGDAWTTVQEWDRRTAQGVPRASVGSVDAHGPIGPLRFPSYEAAFRTMSTAVWMPEPPPRLDPNHPRRGRADAMRVSAALTEGRAATVIGAVGRAAQLSFIAYNGSGQVFAPGAVADVSEQPWKILADLGAEGPYRIALLRDGTEIASSAGKELRYEVDGAGVYRVTIWRTDRATEAPWIITNPIYLWSSAQIAGARLTPMPPLPAPPVDESLLPLTGWVAEADASSHSALAPTATGLSWDLRLPREMAEGRYAALAWRAAEVRDWHGGGGLVVSLRSDIESRVSLRLWTRDDTGERRTWEHVIPTTPEARAVPALWSSFRRIDRPGAPSETGVPQTELSRVEGIALVVTPQLVRPGSEMRLTLEQLGRFDGVR